MKKGGREASVSERRDARELGEEATDGVREEVIGGREGRGERQRNEILRRFGQRIWVKTGALKPFSNPSLRHSRGKKCLYAQVSVLW